MTSPALQDLRAKLDELLDNAKTGNIIPVRLPGQVEEIIAAVDAVETAHQEELANAIPEDMDGYMEEEAYFVGHAVHELRTPMTSIRGYSDMLGQMGELNDMQKQFFGCHQNQQPSYGKSAKRRKFHQQNSQKYPANQCQDGYVQEYLHASGKRHAENGRRTWQRIGI